MVYDLVGLGLGFSYSFRFRLWFSSFTYFFIADVCRPLLLLLRNLWTWSVWVWMRGFTWSCAMRGSCGAGFTFVVYCLCFCFLFLMFRFAWLFAGVRPALEHGARWHWGDDHDRGDWRRDLRRSVPHDQTQHTNALCSWWRSHPCLTPRPRCGLRGAELHRTRPSLLMNQWIQLF